jgi:hypothetical protein
VDTTVLIHVAVGRLACSIATRLLRHAKFRIVIPLNASIKQFYARHLFRSMARLDVPTFEDSAVQRQLESAVSSPMGSSVAWATIQMVTNIVMTTIRLISEISVLFTVLREQQDGLLLAFISVSHSIFDWYSGRRVLFNSLGRSTTNVLSICLSQTRSLGCNHEQ